MFLLQVPPPTRYDLRFSIAGIPVRVHPLFWLIALVFGSSSSSITGILTWIIAMFIAILIHELGHAFAMRTFGQGSSIVLHFAGGLTVPETIAWGGRYASIALTPNQQAFISLAGPLAGFFLAGTLTALAAVLGAAIVPNFIFGFIPFPIIVLPIGGDFLNSLFMDLMWISIFWGIINLMPVQPLDGGSIARQILIQTDPYDGHRKALWLSVASGAIVAVLGLVVMRSTYMAILFGLLAFQSYQTLRSGAGIGY